MRASYGRFLELEGAGTVALDSNFPKRLFLPWNSDAPKNTARELVINKRPLIFSQNKESRFCKEYIYRVMKLAHTAPFNIKGKWTGLCGDHPGEIFCEFSPYIKGTMTNCEINGWSAYKYREYLPVLRKAYPRSQFGVHFNLKKDDMLDWLLQCKRDQSFIDFDTMIGMRDPLIHRILAGVNTAAANRSVLAVWHCVGRTCPTLEESNTNYRPYLKALLERNFNILKYSKCHYWEGFPMLVDMFTLERKAA